MQYLSTVFLVLLVPTLAAAQRILQNDENRVRTELVRLIPFDVQIAMTGSASAVNIFALRDIVTDWMSDSFEMKSLSVGLLSNNTQFNSVALEYKVRRRALQDEGDSASNNMALYTASLEGVSLWDRTIASEQLANTEDAAMDPELVELIQRATFLEDNKLLELMQAAEDYTGLGSTVVDVRAFITPQGSNNDSQDQSNNSAGDNNNLEIIIIIAIVVACLAFGLLLFAVVWAWRTDQTKREAYKVDRVSGAGLTRNPDGTGSESDYERQESPPKSIPQNPHLSPQFPTEIAHQEYPESVISEDISTSLTAYYRSGMAGYSMPHNNQRGGRADHLNDAASMSSMDSYGYSLDGYAPSLSGGPTQMGYPVGQLEQGFTPTNGDELVVDSEEDTAVDPQFPDIDP
jgi:hypothetical protein